MTIKKNSNRAKQAIANAQNVVCFSLTNNFFAKPLADKPYLLLHGPVSQAEFLTSKLAMPQSRISLLGDRYTIHVHSNLWYEFIAREPDAADERKHANGSRCETLDRRIQLVFMVDASPGVQRQPRQAMERRARS